MTSPNDFSGRPTFEFPTACMFCAGDHAEEACPVRPKAMTETIEEVCTNCGGIKAVDCTCPRICPNCGEYAQPGEPCPYPNQQKLASDEDNAIDRAREEGTL